MRTQFGRSKDLRQLAESIVRELVEETDLTDSQSEGLATSLVRQWVTYDGMAALHIGVALVYLSLIRSPLGSYSFRLEPGASDWLNVLVRDWRVDEGDLPGMVDQLNMGQSAEITNRDGEVLRWWVNPRDRSTGVEEGSPDKNRKSAPNDDMLLVCEHLQRAFSGTIPEKEIPLLAQSILKQWARFEGRAALFTEQDKFAILKELHPDGSFTLTLGEVKFHTRQRFEDYGIPPEEIVQAIACINLGQTFSFVDQNGDPVDFWQDPLNARFVKSIGEKPRVDSSFPPIVCPGCGGILDLWEMTQVQQACRLCAQVVQRNSGKMKRNRA